MKIRVPIVLANVDTMTVVVETSQPFTEESIYALVDDIHDKNEEAILNAQKQNKIEYEKAIQSLKKQFSKGA